MGKVAVMKYSRNQAITVNELLSRTPPPHTPVTPEGDGVHFDMGGVAVLVDAPRAHGGAGDGDALALQDLPPTHLVGHNIQVIFELCLVL